MSSDCSLRLLVSVRTVLDAVIESGYFSTLYLTVFAENMLGIAIK